MCFIGYMLMKLLAWCFFKLKYYSLRVLQCDISLQYLMRKVRKFYYLQWNIVLKSPVPVVFCVMNRSVVIPYIVVVMCSLHVAQIVCCLASET
jgi:hypothetical protein